MIEINISEKFIIQVIEFRWRQLRLIDIIILLENNQ